MSDDLDDDVEKSGVGSLPNPVDNVPDGVRNLFDYGVNIHKNYVSALVLSALRDRVEEQAEMERRLGIATIGGARGPQDLIRREAGDPTLPIYQIVEFLPNKGRVFIDLMMSELGRGYASGLFGALPYRLWTANAVISRRGLAQQMVHRDEGALPPEMCVRPTLLNIFIALSDFDAEMGATLLAPGSHLFKQPPWLAENQKVDLYPAKIRPGDAVMWEGRTWHCGGEHRSDKARHVVTMGYSLAGVTPQHLYPAILHDNVYATLLDAEREMLGFRAEGAGYTNRIGPRSADDSRTNTNRPMPFVPELHR